MQNSDILNFLLNEIFYFSAASCLLFIFRSKTVREACDCFRLKKLMDYKEGLCGVFFLMLVGFYKHIWKKVADNKIIFENIMN